VRITAEGGLAAGVAEGVEDPSLIDAFAFLFEFTHLKGGVTVAAALV
jgi:hypothetical protein